LFIIFSPKILFEAYSFATIRKFYKMTAKEKIF